MFQKNFKTYLKRDNNRNCTSLCNSTKYMVNVQLPLETQTNGGHLLEGGR